MQSTEANLEIPTRDRKTLDTVDHLASRWAGADKALLRPVFPLLAEGRPVSLGRIGKATGASESAIEEALLVGRAGRDFQGRVTELFGITLTPTLHRVEVGGVSLFTCCAVIAHMVPGLVEGSATIESVDPENRRIVRVCLGATGTLEWDPPEAVGCLAETKLSDVLADVGTAFCSHAHHFAGSESALRFRQANPARFTMEMPDFHAVGVLLHQRIWA
jgi:alkylmercury lyase